MPTPKKKNGRRGPTRTYSATFSDHSGYLAVVIGNDPEVESTIVVWFQNTIALYDGDDFKFGITKPLKVQYVEKQPKLFFDSLCRLTDFHDQDNLRDYIKQSKQPGIQSMIASQLRQRDYEIGDLVNFNSTVLEKLRAEVEDYMETSGTPWRKFRTWFKHMMHPEETKPKSKKKPATAKK